jgi:hypothetical protein
MSTATRTRRERRHDHQRAPVRRRLDTTLDVRQPETVDAEPVAIDPHDESWRPFPYYGERPDDRPTLTGLIKSRLTAIFSWGT